jgi:hypothetical protein
MNHVDIPPRPFRAYSSNAAPGCEFRFLRWSPWWCVVDTAGFCECRNGIGSGIETKGEPRVFLEGARQWPFRRRSVQGEEGRTPGLPRPLDCFLQGIAGMWEYGTGIAIWHWGSAVGNPGRRQDDQGCKLPANDSDRPLVIINWQGDQEDVTRKRRGKRREARLSND